MRKKYESYGEISNSVKKYLLTVFKKTSIIELSLDEINGKLEELDRKLKNEPEDYDGGWV